MILHYLGVDHVGHIEGPNSRNMIEKLAEMDAILMKIYNQVTKQVSNVLMIIQSNPFWGV